jgi:hypothetical protein
VGQLHCLVLWSWLAAEQQVPQEDGATTDASSLSYGDMLRCGDQALTSNVGGCLIFQLLLLLVLLMQHVAGLLRIMCKCLCVNVCQASCTRAPWACKQVCNMCLLDPATEIISLDWQIHKAWYSR